MKVCIFAGARGGSELMSDNRLIGAELAKRGCSVYYGGSRKGVMGAVADGFKDWHRTHNSFGDVHNMIGVLPLTIARLNHWDPEVTNVFTDSMPERKSHFWKCDAFLCLPGAAGTMDELFEIWTESKLGHQRTRPIVVFNQGGFYDALEQLIKRMVWSGTMPVDRANLVQFTNNPIDAVNRLFTKQEQYQDEIKSLAGHDLFTKQEQYHDEIKSLAGQDRTVPGSESGQGSMGRTGTAPVESGEPDRPQTD